MSAQIVWMLLSAVLASVFTIGVAWLWWRKSLSKEIDQLLDEKSTALSEEIERRVRQGIIDGVSSIPSAEVLESATRTATKAGAAIIGEGLSTLLGRKNKKP